MHNYTEIVGADPPPSAVDMISSESAQKRVAKLPSSVGSLAIHKQPRDLEIVCRPSCNLTRQDYEEFFDPH